MHCSLNDLYNGLLQSLHMLYFHF